MISRRNVIGCIVAIIVLASSTTMYMITSDPGGDIVFESILRDTWGRRIEDERNLVITDNETWAALWIEMNHVSGPPPPTPYVNFTSEWLVAVCLGTRPTGGYSVNITRIGRSLFYYRVCYEELDWQGGAIQVETYPLHIVKISGSPPDLPVHFVYTYVPEYEVEP